MKKLMLFLILISLIFPLVLGVNYRVDVNVQNYNISITSIEIDYFSEQSSSYGNFSLAMFDDDKNVLYVHYFDFDPVINAHYIDNDTGELISGEIELTNISFYFILPYFSNATFLEVYLPNSRKVAEYNLGDFSVILPEEEFGTNKTQESKGDIEKIIEEKQEESVSVIESLSNNLWIFVVLFVILLVVFLYTWFNKKK